MKRALLFSLFIFLWLKGCIDPSDTAIQAPTYFEEVPWELSGIEFENILSDRDSLNILEYLYYYNGGGVAIGDINNDGLEDIYFTANQGPDRLYLNLGGLTFKDITESAKILLDSTWSTGVTMEDVNNDGYLDIYVSKVGNYKGLKGHNLLYLNNGDLTFTEASEQVGLDFSGFSTQASFFDYDGDGDLDMYLMNHSVHTPRSYGDSSKRAEKDSLSGDRLYENLMEQGTLTFKDVTEKAGIYSSALGYGLALVTADVNNDGRPDIYVGNDFHENDYLYINQGDKTFKEEGAHFFNHNSRFTMGVDIADMDNDGHPEIFTLDMMPFDAEVFMKSGGEDSDKVSLIKEGFGYGKQYARNTFQRNNGNSTFSDIALMTNTHATDWSWTVLMEDFDNDGLKDIFISNGIYKRPNDLDYINFLSSTDFSAYDRSKSAEIEKKLIENMPSLKIPNVLFRNRDNFDFERLTKKGGFAPSYSNGAATADLDNDGDMDLVVNNLNAKAVVLENKSVGQRPSNWAGLILKGDETFPVTTGTKVILYANDKKYHRELIPTRGFQSASTRKIHFGLGTVAQIDSTLIVWPDGQVQKIDDLALNTYHTVHKGPARQGKMTPTPGPLFLLDEFPYSHRENDYLDYEREPLMPEKLSAEGPAVLRADFNGDGVDDLFIGGGAQQEAVLFIHQDKGGYLKMEVPAFDRDKNYEDVAAVAFDLENDGDLDIYVTSGGNDNVEGNPQLEDRLYINDGKGNFERFESVMPRFNGGSVASADYDGDGFADLFIGSRSIPGGYGLTPFSLILRNTGKGNFEIAHKARLGMITCSQWADMNNDGRPDLVLAGDWMPITVLINNGDGSFKNQNKALGLAHTSGMWNTLWVADLDGNGHMDIVAGNAGLNMKWKASQERPIKMYLDDFDANEQLDPLIFYNFFGNDVPFASKDALMRQLPGLKKTFLSYNDFSKIKSLEDLTGIKPDSVLETKQIQELRSMVFLNSGKGFNASPLPMEAQMSGIQSFYLEDGENGPVLWFAGNYVGYVTELGDSNSNPGGILSGFKNGHFDRYEPLPLPKGLSFRKIVPLDDGRYLFISNNDKAYTISRAKP